MTFVKAYPKKDGDKRQIWYEDEKGAVTIHEGGSRSWRNNNPGNLRFGKSGAIGTDDGKFSIFPDVETGRKAKVALIQGKYKDYASVKEMLEGKFDAAGKFVPGSGYAPRSDSNDPDDYAAFIAKKTGLDTLSKKISDFTDDEISKIVDAMKIKEGWNIGTVKAGTASPTVSTSPFEDIRLLEQAAKGEGYSVAATISAIRKIWYPGGMWDQVIPGAASVVAPSSWSAAPARDAHDRVRANQVLELSGVEVDVGHLFTGLDARNHPARLALAGGVIKLRSNQEQATFVGDLGSVAAEYIHSFPGSFYDLGRKRDDAFLARKFDEFCSATDMAGNMDSYLLDLSLAKDLAGALDNYYAQGPGMSLQRNRLFAPIARGTTRDAWREEIFNSALGYAGGRVYSRQKPNWIIDVADVLLNPGPGIQTDLPVVGDLGTPTWWEVYFNVSQWTADLFLKRYG